MDLSQPPRVNKKTTFKNRLLLKRLLAHKYLFLVSVLLFLTGAYFHNLYTPPVYLVKSSVLVKEADPSQSDMAQILYEKTGSEAPVKNMADEIAILKSFPFIYRTMKTLNFRVSYFTKDQLTTREMYENLPFRVSFIDSTLTNTVTGSPFQITFIDKNYYTLENEGHGLTKENAQWKAQHKVGETVMVNGNSLLVEITPDFKVEQHARKDYEFIIHDWNSLVMGAKGSISILFPENESSVLDIYYETSIPQKGIDFLNAYTKQYIDYKYENKNKAATQTLDFIDEQLAATRSTLTQVERQKEAFKAENTYSEANSMTDRGLSALSQLENDKAGLIVNERYYNSILQSLNSERNLDKLVVPSSIGIDDPVLNNLISQLVELQIERNTFSSGGQTKNPVYQELTIKINNIRRTLQANLNSLLASNRIRLSQINSRSRTFQENVNQVPKAERQFVNIERLYELNSTIYQTLLQKKVEAGIIKASATIQNRVIEPAYNESGAPIQPKKTNTYILALLLGLGLPFAFVWIKGAMNNKIASKDDVMSLTSMPVLGTIYHNTTSSPYAITTNSRTAISESFRVLRSTLNSMGVNKPSQVLLVTSTSSGEGKTFNSINIASSLALARKKTILINLDLRIYSQLHKLMKQEVGISSYLNGDIDIKDIIFPTDNPMLDTIATGPLPNNPAELILDDRFPLLINHLRENYDYIIIDSPPLGIVSDPYIIARYTDLNLLVIRQGYTPKDKLVELEQIYQEGRIRNVGIILNDVPASNDKYQYGYFSDDKKKVKAL
ncbi:sugar transporter [Adhaeribacter aerolatus]|uniref:non-specific protein-tyrosine kinase n=1 Tax=Adhaeribacter aerolatus TaxID=670289 RepID=A0A512AW26_9BACT|nr:tyrosine-protein kinase [Adhaeribacter aerolatus]GEO03926.1 sugar transporter [Adhaeribacter aerolatus]